MPAPRALHVEPLERRALLSVAGTLDPTFGVNGQLTLSLVGPGGAVLNTVRNSAAQPDGKILVVGSATGGNNSNNGPGATEAAVARLNADGTPDTTFGTSGVVLIPAPVTGGASDSTNTDYASGVTTDAAGNILVSATFSTITNGVTTSDQFAVARLLPSGAADPAFGGAAANGTGVVVANFPAASGASAALAEAHALALQADGKIVSVGVASIDPATGASKIGIARFNTDGSPDATFGAAGVVDTSLSGDAEAAFNLRIQPDNKVLVVGTDYATAGGSTTTASFLVARFNPDGSSDTGFGKGGLVATSFGGRGQPAGMSAAAAVDLSDDGTIYAGGLNVTTDASGNPSAKFALALYHPNGQPNRPFGRTGQVQGTFGTFASVNHVTILPNDAVVVSGIYAASAQNQSAAIYAPVVAQYTNKGVLNPQYGNKGVIQLPPAGATPGATPAKVSPTESRVEAANVLLSTFGPSAAGRSLVALAAANSVFQQFQNIQKADAAIALALAQKTLLVGSSAGQIEVARLVGSGPDVAVLSVAGVKSSSILGGSKSVVTVTVSNQGDMPLSGTVPINLSLSPGGTTFATQTLALRLQPNGRRSVRFPFTFPSSAPAGSYALTATAVPAASIGDTVSTDDAASSAPPFTLAPAFVDLGGSFGALPASLTAGGKANVTLNVQNSGNVPARGTVTITLLASPDTSAADGTALGAARTVKLNLKNGAAKPVKLTAEVPSSLAKGNDFLIAELSAPGLNDNNLSNNTVVSGVAVV